MRTIIIPVKEIIASDWEGYNNFLATYDKLRGVKDANITFDFQHNTWLEANLCAIFGAMIEMLQNNGNTVHIESLPDNLKNVLLRNGFLEILFDTPKINDNNTTILQYQKYKPNDDAIFKDYIKKELLLKPDFPKHSEKLGKKITESIFELYENARTHGKCSFIHVCGQYFPTKVDKPMHITIVDRGISIRKNVRDHFSIKTLSGVKAINWAMQKGTTTKKNMSGGLGLDLIFEFVKLNKGKIQIISSNGYWEYNKGETIQKTFPTDFVGTIANIRFNLDDSNYYSLLEEEKFTLDNLF